jgi:flagellar motility protein MotE (MotC chaperone)
MTELDFWAALVRDYPQTAQRLPTVTSNKIRCGIPAPLRGVVWLSMAGARDKSVEERYDKLCGESSPYEKMIGKDIGRSFPGHEMFRDPDGEGQKMLGRVLKCYSLYDDKIGYCQGLGFLVGPLLMNMGDKEAFCVLVKLMEDYDLRSCFLPDLSGLHLRIYQFNKLLHQHVPKVAAHLDNLGMEGEYLSQWFLSFFAVTCPLPLLFRIYDVVFAEGASETLMRVALSIMQRNEKKILAYAEFEDVMQLLLSRQLWDVYGLSAISADEFVYDFVSFTSLVTRESLDALEFSFREAQGCETGSRNSFLPNVSNAAARFLGRLWTSPKSQNLSPGNANTSGSSRPSSMLLRTPSKQSLSTISSMEASSDSVASSASTAITDPSRESSVDSASIMSGKSPTDSMAHHSRTPTAANQKELDSQIEDLLTVLSEMQRNQALLAAQLQRCHEERNEDHVTVRSLVDQIKNDLFSPSLSPTYRRRAASEVGKGDNRSSQRTPGLSPETIRLLETLDNRLSDQARRSSGFETKADLRTNLSNLKEQLYAETSRGQQLSRDLEAKDQDIAGLREELREARTRIKDTHFDKQRLEKTILDLKQSRRKQGGDGLSRSNSKVSGVDSDEARDTSDQATPKAAAGLRELRLGRGLTRNNSDGPTQVFNKRTSSLMNATGQQGLVASMSQISTDSLLRPTSPVPTDPYANRPSSPRNAASMSLPALQKALTMPPHHENDALLLELANAKTAEAIARQELEEMRIRFDGMRKMMTGATPPISTDASNDSFAAHSHDVKSPEPKTAPASTAASSGFGFFGWGKR